MTISTPVLIGIFLLCCTGCLNRPCRKLAVGPGSLAALALLLALLSKATVQPWRMLSVHPASLLILTAAVLWCRRFPAYGLLTAFTGATIGWLFQTLFPAFPEPCLFVAAPAALLSVLFLKNRREGLASVLLSPLLNSGLIALSDWYLFDDAVVALGSAQQLDAQACGALLMMALLLPQRKKTGARSGFHQNEA